MNAYHELREDAQRRHQWRIVRLALLVCVVLLCGLLGQVAERAQAEAAAPPLGELGP